jgi:asparagine synthase (glutamine-hydrolysing)
MCGIVGIIDADRRAHRPLVRDMATAIRHRGPDSAGFHATSIADVGIRRLSIVDLQQGDQPIFNETETLAIVFNGEIYNYPELRTVLEQRGHRFRTRTDTEVILHLYEDEGAECLARLHGMFAFAIVGDHEVFLARDRLGIKPLYLTEGPDRRTLLFASEIKALLRCPTVDAAIDESYLADRFVLNHETCGQTAFKAIRCLPPGSYCRIRVDADGLQVDERRYYAVSVGAPADEDPTMAASRVRAALEQAVRSHARADVEVGLTLSGGTDSSLLAWLLHADGHTRTRSFTIACDPDANDRVMARRIAGVLDLDHEEVLPEYDEFIEAIPGYVWTAEAVPSLFGLPFHLLCQRIGARMKVCLNGEGADELFAGYGRYVQWKGTAARFVEGLASADAADLPVSMRARGMVEAIAGARDYDEYLRTLLQLHQRDQLEFNHLAVIDRHAMAASLEVRVPFLDDHVIETANGLPLSLKARPSDEVTKYILKRVLIQLAGEQARDVVQRSKDGMPMAGQPYRDRFTQWCARTVSDDYVSRHHYRDFFCRTLPDGRIAGKSALVLFDLFEDIYVRHRGAQPTSFSMTQFVAERSSDASAVTRA